MPFYVVRINTRYNSRAGGLELMLTLCLLLMQDATLRARFVPGVQRYMSRVALSGASWKTEM